MSEEISINMRWHREGRINDGLLRHPPDSLAWQKFDEIHPWFASDPRNVRLGLATDGFNPPLEWSIQFQRSAPLASAAYSL